MVVSALLRVLSTRPILTYLFLLNNQQPAATTSLASRQYYQSCNAMASSSSSSVEVKKSQEDARLYRGMILDNGLKVLLVSDPTTDKAAAALDVHIGHMSDPWKLPGLAHFLEHMLFLGTEKYPDENEYNKYLSQHGGSSNAYTACDHTNFFFDVAPKHLPGTIDRFAQFFLKPTFTESATDREVKAVNSENDKNLASDAWRQQQLERSLSHPDHDYAKFGTGNSDTLDKLPKANGDDVRKELLAFHEKWYSSNIMAFAVLGNQSLDELQTMVVNLFEGVVNKDVTVPTWPEHPYRVSETGGSITYTTPVKDLRQLNITFPIPDLREHYKSRPVHYLSHLMGHEGKGSVLSELKALGYANNLVGGLKSGSNGFDFFVVNLDLTEEGIEHIEDITQLVFTYLDMIRETGVEEWVFQECKSINDMLFRFKDKERPQSYVSSLADRMHDYPLDEVLTGPWIMDEWDPDLIRDILSRLVPENVYITVVGQRFSLVADQTEPWYGTKYVTEKISTDKIKSWSESKKHERLHLPTRNEFIPTDFELVARDAGHKLGKNVPANLKESALSRLWYKQDDEFLLPKACMDFELRSPIAYLDPHHYNLAYMFVSLFNDAMNEYVYDAELAGLWYSMSSTKYGISLTIRGYHEKQGVLLAKLASHLVNFKVKEDRFKVLKEPYIRGLKNFDMEQPHSHAVYRNNVILAEKLWTKEELVHAASHDDLSADAVQAFIPQFLSRLHIEALVHGNITPENALSLLDILESRLATSKPLPAAHLLKGREFGLANNSSSYFVVENNVHKSSCIEMYLQVGGQTTRNNMLLELFAQIISEPCFDVLRTKEQLGYIVFSGVRRSSGVQGLRIIVQSTRKPAYLDQRIEAFLKGAKNIVMEMNNDDFEKHRQALADKRLEKPKKLSSRTEKFWSEITSQQFNFERDEVEVEELGKITRDDLLAFYDRHIAKESPERRKLCSHVVSVVPDQEEDAASGSNANEGVEEEELQGTLIKDVVRFKASLPLHPLIGPYVDLETLKR